MEKWRVLLLSAQQLLGESLEHTLRQVPDLEVTGPLAVDDQTFQSLADLHPDLVIIAEESVTPEDLSPLAAQIVECFTGLPVFRVTLEQSVLRVYSSYVLPARSADLIDLIHRLPQGNSLAGQDPAR